MSTETILPRKPRIRPPLLKVSEAAPIVESRSLTALYQVVPSIFISGYEATKDIELLRRSQITHILNLAGESKCPNCFPYNFKYFSLKMPDNPKLDILFFLYFALDYILESLRNKGKILVHCVKGTSRAASVVLAYLMVNGYSEQDAYSCLLNSQPTVDPNFGFVCQLKEWGKERNEERIYVYSERYMMFVNGDSPIGCRIQVFGNNCLVCVRPCSKEEEALALECVRVWDLFNREKAQLVYM
jgi:protein-tyrosine phosphatase